MDYTCPLLDSLYSQDRCAQFAFAAWIWQRCRWYWWVTWTFEQRESVDERRTTVGIQYARRCLKTYLSGLYVSRGYVVVMERGSLTGRLHYHALLGHPSPPPRWVYGFSKCEPVVGSESAYYLSKYCVKDPLDIILSD